MFRDIFNLWWIPFRRIIFSDKQSSNTCNQSIGKYFHKDWKSIHFFVATNIVLNLPSWKSLSSTQWTAKRYSICKHSPSEKFAPRFNSCRVIFKLVGETVRRVCGESNVQFSQKRSSYWKDLLWLFAWPIHYYLFLNCWEFLPLFVHWKIYWFDQDAWLKRIPTSVSGISHL